MSDLTDPDMENYEARVSVIPKREPLSGRELLARQLTNAEYVKSIGENGFFVPFDEYIPLRERHLELLDIAESLYLRPPFCVRSERDGWTWQCGCCAVFTTQESASDGQQIIRDPDYHDDDCAYALMMRALHPVASKEGE